MFDLLFLRLGLKILPANTPDLRRSSNSQSPIVILKPKSACKYEDLILSLFFLFNLLLFLLKLGDFFVRMVVLLHTHFLFFDPVHVFVIFWSWNFVGFTLCGARRRVSHCSYSWIWCFYILDLRIVWEEGME